MVEAILSPIIGKLCSLIADEGQLLSGVSTEVGWLRDELRSMKQLLEDAEEGCGGESRAISLWVDQIRDAIYDSEDIIDEYDLLKVSSHASFLHSIKSRRGIGSRISGMRTRLSDIGRRKTEYMLETLNPNSNLSWNNWVHGLLASSPLVHDGEVVGLEEDVEQLMEWVLGGEAELTAVSLVGMGGVGKTTLVKRIYNHGDVKRHFDRSAWIYVSQSIHFRKLLAEMAIGLMEIPSSEVDALSERELQESLLSCLAERRYLLIFDDVWSKRLWDLVRLVLPRNEYGSRVIITTRNSEVASSIGEVKSFVHMLRPLSFDESWILFCNKVFATDKQVYCPEELKEVAEGIVRKCDGLPLAVVMVGGMMSRKERILLEWRHVLDNIYKNFEIDEDGVWRALSLSYKDLPYPLKSCFLICSLFPHDHEISRNRLLRLWMAEGFVNEEEGEVVEDVAEKYLTELINRNMIQVSMIGSSGRVKTCRVHDLLHQFAVSIADKEHFSSVCGGQSTGMLKKARRISFHKNYYNSSQNEGKKLHRSILVFGVSEPFHFIHHVAKDFRIIRILDLEDACIRKLPKEVGGLMHLRYLGLQGTKIKKLPKSLNKLSKLQTLNIRRTPVRKLSFPLKNLGQLRHLEMKQLGHSVEVPKGLGYLERLQVITGLRANGVIVHEIRKLTQLRKLGVEVLQAEDTVNLCSSIESMPNLLSLSISSEDGFKPLQLRKLTLPKALQKLHLIGHIERIPDWFGHIRNLTKLRLGLSQLHEDPFPILKNLPSLIFLQLYEAYEGSLMRCINPGFNKLKFLILTGLDELEEWEVETGAMPCIQELWIMSCSRLKRIPSGFESLTTIRTLRLVNMPEKFIERVSSSRGEDFIRVQQVPSIQVLNG